MKVLYLQVQMGAVVLVGECSVSVVNVGGSLTGLAGYSCPQRDIQWFNRTYLLWSVFVCV